MKKLVLLLGLVVLSGVATYLVCYRVVMGANAVGVQSDGTEAGLAWLTSEFALSKSQYEKVRALHQAHQAVCVDHCARYLAARERLEKTVQRQSIWTPEVGEVIAEAARLEGECRASMLRHAFDVADLMSPEQGRRYLEMIKLQVTRRDPSGMLVVTP